METVETEVGGNRILMWFPHEIFISYEGKVEILWQRNQVMEANMSSNESADNF